MSPEKDKLEESGLVAIMRDSIQTTRLADSKYSWTVVDRKEVNNVPDGLASQR